MTEIFLFLIGQQNDLHLTRMILRAEITFARSIDLFTYSCKAGGITDDAVIARRSLNSERQSEKRSRSQNPSEVDVNAPLPFAASWSKRPTASPQPKLRALHGSDRRDEPVPETARS